MATTNEVAPPPLHRLTVDHMQAPIGLAVRRPTLSWVVGDLPSPRQHEVEVYRIDPTTGQETPAWLSGWRDGPGAPWLKWEGEDLLSDSDYRWQVRIRSGEITTDWVSSTFSTSLLSVIEDEGGAEKARGMTDSGRSVPTGREGDPGTATPWVCPTQTPVTLESGITIEALFSGGAPATPPEERLHPVKLVRQDLNIAQHHGPLVRARLFSSAHGVYEMSINGHRIGNTIFAPGWTTYQSFTEFEVHDVTDILASSSTHTLGLTLGDGWYAGRISILGTSAHYGRLLSAWWQLRLTYADGTTEILTPNDSARSLEGGPLRYSDLLIGELRDDRFATALTGWDQPGFDDSTWDPVRILEPDQIECPTRLTPFRGEVVTAVREIPAVEVLTTPAGEVVVDFGQVIAGRVRLQAYGPEGTTITLEHSEHLDKEGNFFSNVQGPNKDQKDRWILAGTGTPDAPEIYEPTFTFHGFRYVKVSGGAHPLTADHAVAVVISNDIAPLIDFRCSDPDLERLHRNVEWSQRANFLSIPTDCPQRERVGWTGDIQVFAPTAAHNGEVHSFLARWLKILRCDQHADGAVPIISPFPPGLAAFADTPGIGEINYSAGWGDAIIRVPLALWERCGDSDTLAACWDSMQRWVQFQTREAETLLPQRLRNDSADPASGWEALDKETTARHRLLWNSRKHFGDWLAPSTLRPGAAQRFGAGPEVELSPILVAPEFTSEFVASAFHAEALRCMAEIATVLGKDAEATTYRQRWEEVRAAVSAEYIDSRGYIHPDLQGLYVLALAFDLVEAEKRDAVADHLIRLIEDADTHLDTGFLSTPFLLDVLEECGRADLAWSLLAQDTIPSWLYQVREGATTIWESWDAVAPDGTVGPMSFNHYAFGAVDDWLIRRIAGVAPTAPGYQQVTLAPLANTPVTSSNVVLHTPYGELRFAWERTDEEWSYQVHLPSGVEGALIYPDGRQHKVRGPSAETLSFPATH